MSGEAAAPSLGDFFKSKSKKKVKASNLNKDTTTTKTEDPKKKKPAEDDTWQEETVEQTTMKVEVAGKLIKEEEQKDDQDNAAPVWGNVKSGTKEANNNLLTEKRFPTLAKAVQSSSINIDDGSDARVNIGVSKNHFAALEGDAGSEDENPKRPKEIKPAMVSKKKGEFAKVALAREVDKYTVKKVKAKKVKKEEGEDGEEDEDEEEEEVDSAEEAEEADRVKAEEAEERNKTNKDKKKEEKKDDKKAAKKAAEQDNADEDVVAEDLKIQVDLEASKEKYKGRKKMPPVALPREELEEKQNKKVQPVSSKKKKMFVEEETDKKLSYAEW